MTIFNKALSGVAAVALIWSVVSVEKAEAAAIDVMVVVDESGSMSGEHAWIKGMISSLDSALSALGITGNYGLVGYGGANSGAPRTLTDFTTQANFDTAANGLVASGSFEDGYRAMDYGFDTLTFGQNGATATNVILVTDEDRDVTSGVGISFAAMAAQLATENALLNAVVNNTYSSNNNTSGVLGVDADDNAYVADGSGGFTIDSGGLVGSGAGNTEIDYAALALGNGGATWDLNLLRAGGLTADSFTAAFVNIKVQEIQEQIPVPEPGMILITGLGLAVMVGLRRRRASSSLTA